ncbi:MmcQ/YjbR family DNA-binding protein [Tersicoccus sp. Bi-70]|uniref:MmcQ/YjbR family DNA-binding protein n=1 Tax=Tersicoccus sp. Bi-70 TaxID=1897634 RepID=UPI000976B7CB|nr:MmcQ/YjbR family DNA-binding protein [Tersicoccus sp. Bi-70]OMH37083.1 hypothetical protein BGP79_15460 [Tersicoccus sp. Bi-70]
MGSGAELFERIAGDVATGPGVTRGRMFHAPDLRVHGKVFAFVGRDGRLIVKLPPERVQQVLAEGEGDLVELGGRRMREWVGLCGAASGDGAPDGAAAEGPGAGTGVERRWRAAVDDACAYVRRLHEP